MYDLILRQGRVVDPAQGTDRVADIAFADGRVAAIEAVLPGPAAAERDVSNCIVCPGLIDLHAHVYWGGTAMGVDAEMVARRAGTTTLIDAGSAGAANFHGFRRHVIEATPLRVLAFLNIAFPGIYAFSSKVMVGECGELRLLHPGECLRVVNENRDLIVGIKVRVGRTASAAQGVAPLEMALEVAEEAGLPVMAHIDDPPPSRRDVLSRLRPGDIFTHCFRPFPNTVLRADGEVWDDVMLARERGVLFDIGHGGASFGFAVARGMLAKGFTPDAISSDVHALSIDGPAFDLLATMSKFSNLGIDTVALIRAVTAAPAKALRRPDLGTLAVGAAGDATVLAVEKGRFDYHDALGETLVGDHRLVLKAIVLAGGLWQH